tara:strand:- start:2922 stop:3032 length:111 start_codon:yes stop_codon:yes gene_type:complete
MEKAENPMAVSLTIYVKKVKDSVRRAISSVGRAADS